MAYQIEFITDTRFKGTRKQLVTMDKKLKKALSKFPSVSLRSEKIYRLDWPAEKYRGAKSSKQWRIKYTIRKKGRATTWKTIFGVVNKIKPVYFKSVR